jgi:uncharacterized protein YjgD (DUF1641 family)
MNLSTRDKRLPEATRGLVEAVLTDENAKDWVAKQYHNYQIQVLKKTPEANPSISLENIRDAQKTNKEMIQSTITKISQNSPLGPRNPQLIALVECVIDAAQCEVKKDPTKKLSKDALELFGWLLEQLDREGNAELRTLLNDQLAGRLQDTSDAKSSISSRKMSTATGHSASHGTSGNPRPASLDTDTLAAAGKAPVPPGSLTGTAASGLTSDGRPSLVSGNLNKQASTPSEELSVDALADAFKQAFPELR